MAGFFWTSYAVLAGTALGLGGTAIGLIVARNRIAQTSTPRSPTKLHISPSARRT
jgi:hypothetical protein